MSDTSYIYNIPDLPEQKSDLIGVVISLDKEYKQFHCGISFDLNSNEKVLHLRTHNDLVCDNGLDNFQCWIKPHIHMLIQEQMSILCNIIKNRGNQGKNVSYGFLYDGSAQYSNVGQLTFSSNMSGLTCATFVLTIFHSCGVDLIDVNTWPVRSSDISWQHKIWKLLCGLAQRIGIPGLFKHLESELGSPRFRPEEVAVSSALYNISAAESDYIQEEGLKLNQYMWSIC